VQIEGEESGERRAVMILRELLAEYGITTITEFARRAQMAKSQAWGLWHGHDQLGLKLTRQIAQHTGIPLSRLVEVEPTPPTPNQGKGGGRRVYRPPEEKKHPGPPDSERVSLEDRTGNGC
jgi:transcriptional regulator with XRE-family HTH domain